MLYHIVDTDDREFAQYIDCVKRTYWPNGKFEEELESRSGSQAEPGEIARAIAGLPLYQQFSNRNVTEDVTYKKFPFLDRFYEYFLRRHWNLPDSLTTKLGQVNLYPGG